MRPPSWPEGAVREFSEESRLLEGLLSSLTDPVVILDTRGRYLWASPGANVFLGIETGLAKGRFWQDLVTDSFLRRILQDCWESVLERGEPVHEEVAHSGSGGLRHFEVRLSPILDAERRLKAMIVSSRDLTQRKAAEEALRQTEEQLRHAQKMDSLGKLAGGIAHDFNNLMTVVNGYSELVLHTLPAEPAVANPGVESTRALVEEIRDAGLKASMLSQQLLAFSRKQPNVPKPIELNRVIRDMEKMLRRSLTGPYQLNTDLADGLPQVTADPGQVCQILMNLVLNARDAMPKGGCIRLATAEARLRGDEEGMVLSPQPGRFASLSVEDEGMGIGPEIRERLFEPFFSTKDKGKGTGLGLSTVLGIVKQGGGGIALRSRPREGSRFTIFLPLSESSAEATGAASRLRKRIGSRPATILVVEDEEPVRRLVAGILHGEGYQVLQADGSSAALRIFGANPDAVDLVVSDIIMPGMGGTEMIRCMLAQRPALRVVYMSGYVDDETIAEDLGNGGPPLVAKPFTPAALTDKVREVLEESRTWSASPDPDRSIGSPCGRGEEFSR
jgi:PAS domain S-box-containing protein